MMEPWVVRGDTDNEDSPFNDQEEDELPDIRKINKKEAGVRLQLSEVEIRVQDRIGSITASAAPLTRAASESFSNSSSRIGSAGYRRSKAVLQNVFSYINPLGYFKSSQNETERSWEIPFEDIMELSFIGSGGQGSVFSGMYRDKEIAIKKVNDPKQTEIKHLRKLIHPNIIRFLGVCTKPPCYCLIMDYCRLGNLYKYIRRYDVEILPQRVIQWSRDIANGMQFLHSKRIIHRDLKSLNVLVNEDEVLKISDFGTSRLFENQTTKMTVIGSSSWMAPELIRNESCNEKVDVWSFGVCLWEILTREEPYKDLNHGAILYGVGTNKLSLPIPNSCPLDLKLLLENCWQQKPKSRPSFRQILDQLNVILVGEFLNYTPQQYKSSQITWKEEIASIMEQLIMTLRMHNLTDEENASIISRREEELRHAKEVREMYEKKLATATELCEQLAVCKDILTKKEEQLEKLAKKLYKEEWLQQQSPKANSDQSSSSGENFKRIRLRSPRRKSAPVTKQRTSSKSDLKIEPLGLEIQILKTRSQSNASSLISCDSNISSSTNSVIPESLITSHGDYSPAVKDFLDSMSSNKVTAPFTRRHIRAHSYSGQPPTIPINKSALSFDMQGKKQKSFDDELTEVPSSSASDNSVNNSDISSISDNEQ